MTEQNNPGDGIPFHTKNETHTPELGQEDAIIDNTTDVDECLLERSFKFIVRICREIYTIAEVEELPTVTIAKRDVPGLLQLLAGLLHTYREDISFPTSDPLHTGLEKLTNAVEQDRELITGREGKELCRVLRRVPKHWGLCSAGDLNDLHGKKWFIHQSTTEELMNRLPPNHTFLPPWPPLRDLLALENGNPLPLTPEQFILRLTPGTLESKEFEEVYFKALLLITCPLSLIQPIRLQAKLTTSKKCRLEHEELFKQLKSININVEQDGSLNKVHVDQIKIFIADIIQILGPGQVSNTDAKLKQSLAEILNKIKKEVKKQKQDLKARQKHNIDMANYYKDTRAFLDGLSEVLPEKLQLKPQVKSDTNIKEQLRHVTEAIRTMSKDATESSRENSLQDLSPGKELLRSKIEEVESLEKKLQKEKEDRAELWVKFRARDDDANKIRELKKKINSLTKKKK